MATELTDKVAVVTGGTRGIGFSIAAGLLGEGAQVFICGRDPAILKAAKRAGVKYYFIEDESPAAAEQIPQSLRFLEQVTW